jgi:hypothetical protein
LPKGPKGEKRPADVIGAAVMNDVAALIVAHEAPVAKRGPYKKKAA